MDGETWVETERIKPCAEYENPTPHLGGSRIYYPA